MTDRALQRTSLDGRGADAGHDHGSQDGSQNRAPGAGRHRARHRAERPVVQRRLLSLPSAAAALVTLTAVGVVASGSTSPTLASAQPSSAPAAVVQGPADSAGEARHVTEARAAAQRFAAARALTRKVARERAEARARASRAAARVRLVTAQQAKQVAAQQAAAEKAHDWVLPVRTYRFTSPFGMRWGRLHAGDDFAAPVGTPAYAMSSGTVTFAGQESGYGTKLEVRYWDGTVSWYGHLSSIGVQVGDDVTPGEVVGATGNTGQSTGPHLHLEIHPDGGGPINPKPWLAAHGVDV